MKRITLALLLVAFAAPAFAGFQAEQIDDGLYFVWYERGRWTAGSVLDTARKARRKLERLSHGFCLAQGYNYMRFVTLGEISRDEELQRAWKLAIGDESADSYEISDGEGFLGLVSKTHKSARLLKLSEEYQEGWTRCATQRRSVGR